MVPCLRDGAVSSARADHASRGRPVLEHGFAWVRRTAGVEPPAAAQSPGSLRLCRVLLKRQRELADHGGNLDDLLCSEWFAVVCEPLVGGVGIFCLALQVGHVAIESDLEALPARIEIRSEERRV